MDAQYAQMQGQQIQGRNQQAQLGLQERQYDDGAAQRGLANQEANIKSRAWDGDPEARKQYERMNPSKIGLRKQKMPDPSGSGFIEQDIPYNTATGVDIGGIQQDAEMLKQLLAAQPDKAQEHYNRFYQQYPFLKSGA
jgi:hypothetical protein